MFFYHFLQLCPQGHISKMLAVTVIKNTVISAFGIFKSVSWLIRMRLSKNFFFKHVLLSFSSTFPQVTHVIKNTFIISSSMRLSKNFFFKHVLLSFSKGHISKMLAVTVIKNTVISAFGIFKSVSWLIQMRLSKNFFFKHVLLSFSSTLSPRSHLEKNVAVTVAVTVIKITVFNNGYSKHFRDVTLGI